MRRILALAAAAGLAAGCSRTPDRMVAADGSVVMGRLRSLSGGEAVFEGFSTGVPSSQAVVLLRSGVRTRGAVTIEDRVLTVDGPGYDTTVPLREVASISWGPSSVQNLLMDVSAAAGWTCTHVEVVEGSQVVILAGGRTNMGTGSTGPSGTERTSSSVALAPEARDGELVARIGEDGRPFAVGESWAGVAGTGGCLWLAVSVPSEGVSQGFYTVSVTVGEAPGDGAVVIYPARK